MVPLTCDPRRGNETCLISETDREGIVFWLEKEGERTWLRTDDMTQYTLAVDRQNERLGDFYNAHHKAVLQPAAGPAAVS